MTFRTFENSAGQTIREVVNHGDTVIAFHFTDGSVLVFDVHYYGPDSAEFRELAERDLGLYDQKKLKLITPEEYDERREQQNREAEERRKAAELKELVRLSKKYGRVK